MRKGAHPFFWLNMGPLSGQTDGEQTGLEAEHPSREALTLDVPHPWLWALRKRL